MYDAKPGHRRVVCAAMLVLVSVLVWDQWTRGGQNDLRRVKKSIVVAKALRLTGPKPGVWAELIGGSFATARLSFFGTSGKFHFVTELNGDPRISTDRAVGSHELDLHFAEGRFPGISLGRAVRPGLDIGIHHDDTPVVEVGYEKARGRVSLVGAGLKDQRMSFSLRSPDGKLRGMCYVDLEKYSGLSLYDQNASVRMSLGIFVDSPPVLNFYDSVRRTRLRITQQVNGRGTIRLFDLINNQERGIR